MRVKLTGLTKEFTPGQPILSSIDFDDDIHSLAIIGPSGGGKSTLLRILGGLLPASAGTVSVDGRTIGQNESERQAYRMTIGFVFQQGGLFEHLTARQNITLPLVKVRKWQPQRAEARADELLTRFGLLADGDKKPAALSGGQKQRIAIARAIAPTPGLLLLDEPTSALDPEFTGEVLDMVEELRQNGMDIIIVTHEMGFARHACEKTAFLHGGSLLEYGNSEALFTRPSTPELKAFLGKLLEWRA